jgi:hypothetical protein
MVVYFLVVGLECHSPQKFDVDLVLVANPVFLCHRLGWGWLSSTIALTSIVVYPTNWVSSSQLSHGCVTYVDTMSLGVPKSLLLY